MMILYLWSINWIKQVVECLNRTFKSSYHITYGNGNENGALYGVSIWVVHYNFLCPHPYNYFGLDVLNQSLIFL